MVPHENAPDTPEAKIVHRAKDWRETEKAMIAARPEQKPEATQKHFRAKQQLREAVDLSESKGGRP